MSSKYNITLTNYARGLSQDGTPSLATFIAPEVVVQSANGQYKDFSDKNAFQNPDTRRAIGGPARRLEFEADDPFFNCNPHALEISIDDHERRQAGEGDVLGMEKAKTRTLISSAKVAHESAVFKAASTSITAIGGVGEWGGEGSTADPVAELDALIEDLATQTGQMPNRLALGLPAWRRIRHNPAVIKRFPGAASVGVTLQQFAGLLLNPQLDIRVGIMSADTTKAGKAKNAVNIIGSELYLFIAQASPSVYDPSFMKTFRTRGGGVDMVRIYRAESNRSDILAVDWTEDIKVTSPVCARRVTVTDAA
jgi:hypothetical protein